MVKKAAAHKRPAAASKAASKAESSRQPKSQPNKASSPKESITQNVADDKDTTILETAPEQLRSSVSPKRALPSVEEDQPKPKRVKQSARMAPKKKGIIKDVVDDKVANKSGTESHHPISSASPSRALAGAEEGQPKRKGGKQSSPMTPEKKGSSSKETFPSPPEQPASKFDKEKWQGFCEIESDPAYFSVILREIGVQGVTVRELFAMTPDMLDMLPKPIYGLVFLFRYRDLGNEGQAKECPPHVWFANQLPGQNSCSTLAMIQILMNVTGVDIGEYMVQFKDYSKDLTPYQRGEAFASWRFVKKIHNSFAKKMDILENDSYLANKVAHAEKLKEKGVEAGRRGSASSESSSNSIENFERNAHHFIAFAPAGNEVWKLDGMDAQPTSLGTYDPEVEGSWLGNASEAIDAYMAAGDDDYSVFAITQAPTLSIRRQLSLTSNTVQCVEARLDQVDEDWKAFLDESSAEAITSMFEDEDLRPSNPVSDILKAEIDAESLQDLLARRTNLKEKVNALNAEMAMEMQEEVEQDRKATQRRWDYGPLIKRWFEMLAANGYLEANLHRFMDQ